MVDQVTEKTKSLLMTEEEWLARNKSRMMHSDLSSLGGKGGGHQARRDNAGRGGSDGNKNNRDHP